MSAITLIPRIHAFINSCAGPIPIDDRPGLMIPARHVGKVGSPLLERSFLTAPCQSPRPARRRKPGSSRRWCRSPSADDVGDTGPARIGKAGRHFVDYLLALVVERRRQAGKHRLDLVGRQPGRLASTLMRVGRVDRMPPAVDDDDGDFALTLAQRIAGTKIALNGPITFASLGLCPQTLFGPPSAPRVSISKR
jgi:hypothetical protein